MYQRTSTNAFGSDGERTFRRSSVNEGNYTSRNVGKTFNQAPTASRRPFGDISNRLPFNQSKNDKYSVRQADNASSQPNYWNSSIDIDSKDKSDPLKASEFAPDIFNYYRRIEPQFKVDRNYLNQQAEINDKMRGILIDWLVEVHLKFKLMPETLFITINLIDRYLMKRAVPRKNLQLVGVTAMLLASKYEEIWAPEVKDFIYISDKAYTRQQILHMEKSMLNVLKFNLTVPTSFTFLNRYLKASGEDATAATNRASTSQLSTMALYLTELTLPNTAFLDFPCSLIAASSVYVAQLTFNKSTNWNQTMIAHTNYQEADMKACVQALVDLQRQSKQSDSSSAVFKKFKGSRFGEVAKLPTAVLPQHMMN